MEMTKKKRKGKKTGLLIYMIIFLSLIFSAIYFGQSYFKQSLGAMTESNHKEFHIEIPSGSSTNRISEILLDNGLIKNKLIFKYQVKSLGYDGKLKAGEYVLNTGMDLEEVITAISKGGKAKNTVRFTIPEGYEVVQIAERLANDGLVDKDRFLELTANKSNFEEKYAFLKELEDDQDLEGFLFPSTYEIFTDSTEEDIINKMLTEFDKVYQKDLLPRLEEMNLTLNEAVTLASIVEREGKVDDERPLMSAVFHNRLDQGMALQSCATVQFILGERKEVLSNEDTRIPSPYNTYINEGLPPGPIASPGEKSLIAAVNPADVDYLFFVLTGEDGSHTFTKTYKDHLNAKPKN